MAQKIHENLRMTWDAAIVAVHSAREAIAIAKEYGLTWFDLEEWNARREAWEMLGTWGDGQRRQVGQHPGIGAVAPC